MAESYRALCMHPAQVWRPAAAPLAKTEPLCCCMSNVSPPPLPSGAIPCSYAGRAFEREEEAEAGEGELICKGMRSMWRQVSAALLAV